MLQVQLQEPGQGRPGQQVVRPPGQAQALVERLRALQALAELRARVALPGRPRGPERERVRSQALSREPQVQVEVRRLE